MLAGCATTNTYDNVPSEPTDWVSPRDLGNFWIAEQLPESRRQSSYREKLQCATIGFRINADGTTEPLGLMAVNPENGSWQNVVTPRFRVGVNNDILNWTVFTQAAIDAVKWSQFAPADGPDGGKPVYTYRSYPAMDAPGAGDWAEYLNPLRDWCEQQIAIGTPGPQLFFWDLDRWRSAQDELESKAVSQL